jgi:predicted nuclease with RNAse H fold
MTSVDTATCLGIDLTSVETRPSACALLDASGALVSMCKLATDEEMMDLVRDQRPAVVAIDSPLGLPKGMDCLEESCSCESVHPFKGRVGERDLIRQGINLYVTTKRTIIKTMVYRAIELARQIRGLGSEVIEVYPFASKIRLFGRPIPPKNTTEGRSFLQLRLDGIIPGLELDEQRLDHDHLDALIAAHTAWLYGRGMTEDFGLEEEVPIVVPVDAG